MDISLVIKVVFNNYYIATVIQRLMDKLNPKRNVFKDMGYQRKIHFGTIKL